jgi:hypothetical protein
MNIINHGTWHHYVPDVIPEGYPKGVAYARRDGDSKDWYELLYGEQSEFAPTSIKVAALKEGPRWIVKVASDDATKLFPIGQLLLEVTDYVGSDPQVDLGGKEYVEATQAFTAIPLPPAVVKNISKRQFYQQLAIQGIITTQEALDAVRIGSIPVAIQTILDQSISDPAQKFGAEMLLSGATDIARAHPLTISIGATYGMDTIGIDAFFASALLL